MNRKEFLLRSQSILLASSILSIGGCSLEEIPIENQSKVPLPKYPGPSNPKFDADVIVIGAGASGLYAANECKQANLKVIVLESKDRMGGRVQSIDIGHGKHIELGANWMGKVGQTRVEQLVKKKQIPFLSNFEIGNSVFLSNNEKTQSSYGGKPLSLGANLDALYTMLSLESKAAYISMEGRDASRSSWDDISILQWLKEKSWTKSGKEFIQDLLEQGMCQNLNSISLYESLHQMQSIGSLEKIEGADSYFFPGGFQSVLRILSENLKEEIKLKEKVISIDQYEDRAVVKTKNKMYVTKYIVMAVPPHLRLDMKLEPKLPISHMRVLQNFLRGNVKKTIAIYRSPWWRELGFNGQISSVREGFNFFADLSYESGPGILVGLVGGSRSERIDDLGETKLQELFQKDVRDAFGKFVNPVTFYHHDWNRDSDILGGYAGRRRIGDWKLGGNCLARPFGRIHFAGTETATEWRSYVEGAFQSGERASKEVIEKHFI